MSIASLMADSARFLPLIFAAGFLAPLISQSLTAIGWIVSFGNLPFGLGVAIGWGLIAQFMGRWI
ncbi:hypothetical protein HGI47_19205 [Novosphingobium sp. ERN07]|uniref:hypothetical protein n=1 Tax=Novosphingobium sp. ERN07 TaxID=2726187 RepID=UPI0014570BCB|nr:hypothetical protein [Novosphingobium sp. ERN07]NLR73004.1 hypothetical protein [Novosphingobium sp. ERN07]